MAYLGNVVPLTWIKVGLQRKVGHACYGVHGRADFMAHVSQEFALGYIGGFGGGFGLPQKRLNNFIFIDLLV